MKQYLDMLRYIMSNGVQREDRTGVGTIGVFGHTLRFDLSHGFPLLTTKKLHTRSIFQELLWFIHGRTDVKWLQDRKVTIWDEWMKSDGTIGPGYGHQWRHWKNPDGSEIDQLAQVVRDIRKNPNSRRLIVTAWNPSDISEMKLPPCHMMFQFSVMNGELSCMMYQRSCDSFLGVPFNIASYALLTHMVAHVTGHQPGEFVHVMADTHIYLNHFEQVKLQLSRDPRPLPRLCLFGGDVKRAAKVKELWDFEFEDFVIERYDPHPAIAAPVAV